MEESKVFSISGNDRVFYVKFFKDKESAELFRAGIIEFNQPSLNELNPDESGIERETQINSNLSFIEIPVEEKLFFDEQFYFKYTFFPNQTIFKWFKNVGEHAVVIPDYPFTMQIVEYFDANNYKHVVSGNEYAEKNENELIIREYIIDIYKDDRPISSEEYINVGNLGYTIYIPTELLLKGGFTWQDLKNPEKRGTNEYQIGDVLLIRSENEQTQHVAGFVIGEDQVLIKRNGKTKIVSYQTVEVENKIRVSRILDDELKAKVITFFEVNQNNPFIYDLGVNAYFKLVDQRIFDHPILMPVLNHHMSDDEFEARWALLLSDLKPGDSITTFTTDSVISRTIAAVDGGVWSHIGHYLDQELMCEMLTSGITVRSILNYKNRNVHIGIYRPFEEFTDEQVNELFIKTAYFIKLNPKYNYKGALIKGLKMITKADNFEKITPNGIIYSGQLRLVNYV